MAEREGFEPSVPVKAQRFSRPPRSTTPAPLRTQSRAFYPWSDGFRRQSRSRWLKRALHAGSGGFGRGLGQNQGDNAAACLQFLHAVRSFVAFTIVSPALLGHGSRPSRGPGAHEKDVAGHRGISGTPPVSLKGVSE